MSKIIVPIIAVILVVGGVFALRSYQSVVKENTQAATYKDATYVIDGKSVHLFDGVAESPVAPNSAAKVITRYFGNPVFTDLDGNGTEDVVFLLTQEVGGSGTFFYAVAALKMQGGYLGSHAFFLGDRIAPQTTELSKNPAHKNTVVVNYADRGPGEPMTARPSMGKSVWLNVDVQSMTLRSVE